MTREGKNKEISEKRTYIAALFETHFGRITRYIAIRIGDIAMAEDLASETFVRALRSVDQYKDTGAPMEAWIFRIANNLTIDYIRSMKRKPTIIALDEQHDIEDCHSPEGMVVHQAEIEELNRAMEHLSERQRQVLALRFGGDMTSEEAAVVMGKSSGAIRQMQSDAIKKLRRVLVKDFPRRQEK